MVFKNLWVLCPLVELLAYRDDANCSVEGVFNGEDLSAIVVKSKRPLRLNEQLSFDHGVKSHYDILMKYGKVLRGHPKTTVAVPIDMPAYVLYKTECAALKESLLTGRPYQNILVTPSTVTPESLAFLRLFFLTDEDAYSNKDILNYSLSNFERPVSFRNEGRVVEFIAKSIDERRDWDLQGAEGCVRELLQEENEILRSWRSKFQPFMDYKRSLVKELKFGIKEDPDKRLRKWTGASAQGHHLNDLNAEADQ